MISVDNQQKSMPIFILKNRWSNDYVNEVLGVKVQAYLNDQSRAICQLSYSKQIV